MSVRTHVTSADLLHVQLVHDPAAMPEDVIDVEALTFPVLIIDDLASDERWVVDGYLKLFTMKMAAYDLVVPR